jgi:hypothetical protein
VIVASAWLFPNALACNNCRSMADQGRPLKHNRLHAATTAMAPVQRDMLITLRMARLRGRQVAHVRTAVLLRRPASVLKLLHHVCSGVHAASEEPEVPDQIQSQTKGLQDYITLIRCVNELLRQPGCVCGGRECKSCFAGASTDDRTADQGAPATAAEVFCKPGKLAIPFRCLTMDLLPGEPK